MYRFPQEALRRIPALAMLSADPGELRRRAEALSAALAEVLADSQTPARDGVSDSAFSCWEIGICETTDETGGGALPNVAIPGWAVFLKPAQTSQAAPAVSTGWADQASQVSPGSQVIPGSQVSPGSQVAQASQIGQAASTTAATLTTQAAPTSLRHLEERLRSGSPPVILRLHGDRALISLRTLLPGEENELVAALRAAFLGPGQP